MIGARVLHLLRRHEHRPPDNLVHAAGSLQTLPAGLDVDNAIREFGPQVITIIGSDDFETRSAVEKMADLNIPAIGIGTGPSSVFTTYVSRDISADDLRTVLNLVVSDAMLRKMAASECKAHDTGHCSGLVMDELILLLEHLLSLRIPDYIERADKVFDACLWICNHLSLPPDELKDILRSARLREIGKLGLPDRLLFAAREDRSPAEQSAYNRYPELGAKALNQLATLRSLARIVAHQLENFDGSGPEGLMAHQIPLGSRVLRVAGAFSMLQSPTSGKGYSAVEVLDILDRGRGSLYDPLLVKLIENYHASEKDNVQQRATRWVRVSELAEGMILAEDVWSRTGMKIIPRGTRLTPHILKILHQFPVDPVLDSVRIMM
ncbi:MAG: HD-GYP domain-containing protein [Calditrichota bacterium]